MLVSRLGEIKSWRRAAIAASLMIALSPAALLARGDDEKRPPAIAMSFDRFSSFTPASADPRLAAAFGSRAPSAFDFHFTPAAAKGRPSQVRVAIRARAASPLALREGDPAGAVGLTVLSPASYNLGVAVGWRRFAVSGDVAKVASTAGSPLGGRESAAVGISYNLKRFTGRLAVGADRASGNIAPVLARNDNVAVDVGGAFALSRGIDLTGGVRYKIERDRLSTLSDQRRDSQAVYVGTAFKF